MSKRDLTDTPAHDKAERQRAGLRLCVVFLLLLIVLPMTALAWTGKVVDVADGDIVTVVRGETQVTVGL